MPQTNSLPQSSFNTSWKIKLLYDGLCPLCLREVNFLRRRDAGRGIVVFIDIADLNYNPEHHGGVDFEAAMGRIHAVLPDGTLLRDVEVFRRIYTELGMGWVYAATRWPIVGSFADQVYGLWADWRLKLTGRPSLDRIVVERQTQLETYSIPNSIENRCKVVKQ